jgi:N-acetyl-gamma-glutamyl-phosphate reductase
MRTLPARPLLAIVLAMAHRVFIDGEAGTTGLQIRDRLASEPGLELVHIDEEHRKSREHRARLLNEAALAILCLPDEAARESVSLVTNPEVRILDASSAHRTDPAWVYGLPELTPGHDGSIAASRRVSNPGCYPTGAVCLVRPLVDAGILPADFPLTVNAVSGYTGGGREMIARYEGPAAEGGVGSPFRVYGLDLEHKHVEEIRVHALLRRRPLFAPSVGRFRQGMIVQVPLQLWALPTHPAIADLRDVLRKHYAGRPLVTVVGEAETQATRDLDAEALRGTDRVRLYVFGNERHEQALLVAVLDNLGKGAAGTAVQNARLMLGLVRPAKSLSLVA